MNNILVLEEAKIVAIIRSVDGENVPLTIENLVAAGIKALEITANTPDFCRHITWARKNFPDVIVGAGTVINSEIAKRAMEAQSQFLVTPNMNTMVIQEGRSGGNLTLMGAMTPTDIAIGIEHGADFIKLFPAGPLGIDYFKALLGPFRDTKFIAVGGINRFNAADWFAAGAVGIGVGDSFTSSPPHLIKEMVNDILNKIIKIPYARSTSY